MPRNTNAEIPPCYDLPRRFWCKVTRGEPDACWPWKGAKGDKGYGRFKIEGRLFLTHRVAYHLKHGPIPPSHHYHGTVVMHTCDNPSCCNPAHLRVGRQQDNVTDMWRKGRAPEPRRGEAVPNAKLTVEKVRQIRTSSLSDRVLATVHGVSRFVIRNVRKGKAWPHVKCLPRQKPVQLALFPLPSHPEGRS